MSSNRRPTLLIALCFAILVFSVVHLSGLVAGFRLPELPLPFPAWYLYLRNGIWALAGLVASGALFFSRSWSKSFTHYGALLFVIWYWGDRFFFARSDFSQHSWPATAFVTIIALLALFFILRQPSIQTYLSENLS